MTADRVEFNTDTETGTFYNATVTGRRDLQESVACSTASPVRLSGQPGESRPAEPRAVLASPRQSRLHPLGNPINARSL